MKSGFIGLICMSAAAVAVSGCVSQSALMTHSDGRTITCANSGFGWLGAPIALAAQSRCISDAEAAGYKAQPVGSASTGPRPSETSGSLTVSLPAGWERQTVTDAERNKGIVVSAINRTMDSNLLVSAGRRNDITDMSAYVTSRQANQASRLQDVKQTPVESLTINNRPAWRTEVSGLTREGFRATFLLTIIDGGEQVVMMNAWTSETNFATQRETLQGLASRMSGV